jgi:hypothetical protein
VIWVIVLGCLAVAGVVALVVMTIGVRNKIDDVLVEVRVLEERREELRELTASIQLPTNTMGKLHRKRTNSGTR